MIAVLNNDNEPFLIVGIILFVVAVIVGFIFGIFYVDPKNKKLKKLIIEYAGEVSDADKVFAKTYAEKWKTFRNDIKQWDFSFLDEQDYEDFEVCIYHSIGGLALGVKSETSNYFETIYNNFRIINYDEQSEKTKEIISLYFDIYELFKRNSYTLNVQDGSSDIEAEIENCL